MGLMDDIASRLFKLKVFKNPSPEQMQGLRMEFKEKWPNAPTGEPSTRVTYDKYGNEYRWMADRSHGQVEPELEKLGIYTNQNKYFENVLGLLGLVLSSSDAEANYKPSMGASRSFGTPLQNFENGVMPEGSPITYQQLIDLVTGTVTPFKGLLR